MHSQFGDYYHTGVLFRTFRSKPHDVIALFSSTYHDGSCNRGMCMSYMHVGQHSEADPNMMMSGGATRPATPEEYRDLKKELETIGYRFTKIYQRFPYRA